MTDSKLDAQQKEQISQFITLLWDLRLEVGHSVRTIKESVSLGKDDITIATNLMEMRYLAGNQQLFDSLQVEVSKDNFWPSKDFFQAKRHEQQGRHAQYHGTAYNLEPNLKANPGGLRDIQTIGWVAKKHFRTRTMRELVAYQYLTEDEYQELMECEAYLWQMRFALHMEAGRNENRILFDYQPAVDERLGFGADGKATEAQQVRQYLASLDTSFALHIDLHETTDSDNSEFRPAKAAQDGTVNKNWNIPDGYYTVDDAEHPCPALQKAIIDSVAKVTHIAEADENGELIGEKVEQFGVINYAKATLGLCGSVTDAPLVSTTEVYPDSPSATPEQCIQAQVAAVTGALEYLLQQG